jgi:hypothetical protein
MLNGLTNFKKYKICEHYRVPLDLQVVGISIKKHCSVDFLSVLPVEKSGPVRK